MSVSNAVEYLRSSVDQFSGNVQSHVQKIDTSTSQIRQTADSVYGRIQQFRQDIMQGEEKQIAHENIIRIDQIIKEQFGNYDAIRKTIIGVVRDFDINLVRNSTIEELSEELWITSSRYWLSYALLAVTAWVNNYPEVAKNALSESCRKDQIKSSLFFCLLNLRFERVGTAREWFKYYCKTLNPTMLQQETAVMIQAFMGGVFGKDKQLEHEVIEIINDWIRIISEDAVICQELVQQYENYFEKFHMQAQFDYQMIREFCTNSAEVQASFTDVSKLDSLIGLMEELNEEGVIQTDSNYKSRVDAVLMSLITNYDEEEQELRAEQQYYRLVVENEGQTEIAQDQFEEIESLRKENYNIGKQMIGWVIYDDGQTDVQVRKFGLQSTKAWFQTALENWITTVNGRMPRQFQLAIDEWTGTSSGNDLEEQRTSLNNFFENNKFRITYINTLNMAMLIVLLLSLIIAIAGIAARSPIAIIIGVILLLASLGVLAWNISKGKKNYEQRLQTAQQNLEGTMAQITEFKRYFEENIQKKDDVLAKLSYI